MHLQPLHPVSFVDSHAMRQESIAPEFRHLLPMKSWIWENGVVVTERYNLSYVRSRLDQTSQRLACIMDGLWQRWLWKLRRNLRNDVWHI